LCFRRYLPAGRIEQGETICAAGEREVLEETGLHVECTALLMVECARGTWIRYVLTGRVTGGTLKTPANADKESLQAKWIANLAELTLRATDITQLIDRTRYSLKSLYYILSIHFMMLGGVHLAH
jgi:8-oxo-dGDP phosphatase